MTDFPFPPEAHTSCITLSRSAFAQNLAYVKSRLPEQTELAAVLKGNAYGHGIEPMLELCLAEGVKSFCVFSAHEAYRIRQASPEAVRIILMGYISPDMLGWAIENEIEFFVFDFARLEEALHQAKQLKKKARIHLEVETGMHRTGFETDQAERLTELLTKNPAAVDICGLCTHFAGAEEMANYVRIRKQQKQLRWWRKHLQAEGIAARQLHAACSAALLNYPESQFDLVRVGIMLYGFWPSPETRIIQLGGHAQDPLRRLMRWSSRVMSTKQVALGEYIGYGSAFLATSPMSIALVPVGYAYGFSRSLSNNGRVLIGGQPAPVIGLVNMNLLIVNTTNIEKVEAGEEVVLIGHQGEQEISVASFSEMSQQLNYELLTRLPADIPRQLVE